jgi:hypothetical protein
MARAAALATAERIAKAAGVNVLPLDAVAPLLPGAPEWDRFKAHCPPARWYAGYETGGVNVPFRAFSYGVWYTHQCRYLAVVGPFKTRRGCIEFCRVHNAGGASPRPRRNDWRCPVGDEEEIERLLAQEVYEEHTVEDDGIGPYSYGSAHGIDSVPYVDGMAYMLLPAGMTERAAARLLKTNREDIVERLHSKAFGAAVKWEGEIRVEELCGRRGLALWDGYVAEPPEREPKD